MQNGVSIMYQTDKGNCSIAVTSDASGKGGCGAFFNDKWFQL